MNDDAMSAESRRILRARAEALARPIDPAPHDAAAIEVLEFSLAHERYALEVRYVSSVEPLGQLAPLPCAPPFVAGIVNVRGRLLPVLDLKKFFDLPEQGLTDLHAVIVVSGRDMEFGLLADLIVGVRSVAAAGLQRELPTLTDIGAEYLKGVTAERLVVLDAARIMADPKIIVDEDI
jgi:purine-binding chemotaxis protein CheW